MNNTTKQPKKTPPGFFDVHKEMAWYAAERPTTKNGMAVIALPKIKRTGFKRA